MENAGTSGESEFKNNAHIFCIGVIFHTGRELIKSISTKWFGCSFIRANAAVLMRPKITLEIYFICNVMSREKKCKYRSHLISQGPYHSIPTLH